MLRYADSYTGAVSDTQSLKAIPKTAGQHVRVQMSRPIPEVQSWMPWATDQLNALAKLKPNWDSYGGEPPSRRALNNAEILLQTAYQSLGSFDQEQSQPQIVAPRADGGIQIEWSAYSVEIAVHIDASGAFGYLFIDQLGAEPIYQEVQEASLEEVLRSVASVVFTVPR